MRPAPAVKRPPTLVTSAPRRQLVTAGQSPRRATPAIVAMKWREAVVHYRRPVVCLQRETLPTSTVGQEEFVARYPRNGLSAPFRQGPSGCGGQALTHNGYLHAGSGPCRHALATRTPLCPAPVRSDPAEGCAAEAALVRPSDTCGWFVRVVATPIPRLRRLVFNVLLRLLF